MRLMASCLFTAALLCSVGLGILLLVVGGVHLQFGVGVFFMFFLGVFLLCLFLCLLCGFGWLGKLLMCGR
jgi:hypothetical protein